MQVLKNSLFKGGQIYGRSVPPTQAFFRTPAVYSQLDLKDTIDLSDISDLSSDFSDLTDANEITNFENFKSLKRSSLHMVPAEGYSTTGRPSTHQQQPMSFTRALEISENL